ncbi:MAG TPA: adenylate/guanylate cyclase domain-containing protein [Burkholderiales bacterium]|nr:adenylate/guanylate cyclase domain-containing protein [Burkholderiales bacterium]
MNPRAFLGVSWVAWRHALTVGLVLTILGAALTLVPVLWPLQESFDLWLLFKLRGPKPPPDDIVLVTIDQQSSERITLPRDPVTRDQCSDLRVDDAPASYEKLPPPHLVMRWPRCVHALAVQALAEAGARVIALDISFRPLLPSGSDRSVNLGEEQDRKLANAMESAGNVLIAQWLDPVAVKQTRALKDRQTDPLERPAQISALIESSALGAAPLRLAYGMAGRVNGFATFSQEDGPMSSMPALLLHRSASEVHPELVRLIAKVKPEDAELLPRTADALEQRRPLQATSLLLRHLIRSQPSLAEALYETLDGADSTGLPAQGRIALRALVDLYAGDPVRYLNFYGEAGTFRSVSYADVLKAGAGGDGRVARELGGTTVIVGYVDFTPAQRDDHYPTVYTTTDGVKLSGSEILATAVANLASGTSVKLLPLALRLLVTGCFGIALALALLLPSPVRGLFAGFALCAAYLGLALLSFRLAAIWLPLFIPLAFQAPAGILYAVAYHYRDMRRKRDELRRLFGKFVPDAVIEGLLENRAKLDTVNEPVYGVCLATDAERFTALAEGMHPSQLARFLNRYFEAVFPPITEKEGAIVDLIGDAVLAMWTGAETDQGLRLKASGAALELMTAVDRFNAASPTLRLPTRIGISGGEVATSPMGAINHFEFRPVGDTVVTSVRLQELNKLLGTRILAAEPVVRGLDTLLVRDLGVFQLRGKNLPTHIFEIVSERESASAYVMQLCLEFALALDALRGGRREAALERFRAIHDRYPQDGPTAFYAHWLSANPLWGGGAIRQSS